MKKIIIPVAVLVLVAGTVLAWSRGWLAFVYADYPERKPLQTRQVWEPIKIISHRGDTVSAPENTLPAFRAAIEKNMDYVEMDVRLTSDGVPVVIHDSKVDRTTNGTGLVDEMTFEELRKLDAGSWFSPEFTGVQIPTLEEALSEVAQSEACVMVEFKAWVNYSAIKILKNFREDFPPPCMLISFPIVLSIDNFSPEIEESLKQIAGTAKRERLASMLTNRKEGFERRLRVFKRYWPEYPMLGQYTFVEDLDELFNDFPNMVIIGVASRKVNRDIVEQMHERGILVYTRVAVLNEDAVMEDFIDIYEKLMESGVDMIFTENPGYFKKFQESFIQKNSPAVTEAKNTQTEPAL